MDRKEFLKKLGLGSVVAGAAAMGVTSIIPKEEPEQEKPAYIAFNGRVLDEEYFAESKRRQQAWELQQKMLTQADHAAEQLTFNDSLDLEQLTQFENDLKQSLNYWYNERVSYPAMGQWIFALGVCRYLQGRKEEMITTFNNVSKLGLSHSTSARTLVTIGDYLSENGYNEEAANIYKKALYYNPQAPVKRKIKQCLAS